MLTDLQRKILERLREARLHLEKQNLGDPEQLAEYASITVGEVW